MATIYIGVYLPTHGRDLEFLHYLTELSHTIEDLQLEFPDSPVYLRGDFNVNTNNRKRNNILNSFLNALDIEEVEQEHTTYHHFLGNGSSDSKLDRIFVPRLLSGTEKVVAVLV